MKKILMIGSAHVDFVSYVDKLPQGNEDFNILSQTQKISGTGFQAATIFQRFGFSYALYAPVGTGVYGEMVEEQFRKQGIEIEQRVEEVNGCTYHMIDQAGNQSYFSVPGGEYNFDISYAQTLDKDDIYAVLLFGEMLSQEGIVDLLNTLDDLEKPIYFVPGEFGDQMDEDVFRALISLQPTLLLSEFDAFYLTGERFHDLKMTAEYLHELTKAPVMVNKESEGTYWYGDEKFMVPCPSKINIELQATLFTLAQLAGVDAKNSLLFTNDFVQTLQKEQDDFTFEEGKQKLANIILNKS
ncbi:MAG: PfkB family carbohydrate kinase [Bulleidia sp.]|nr:PfkB family carbohydrate kinase [Bulleidia sp.]